MRSWFTIALILAGLLLVATGCESNSKGSGSKDSSRQSGSGSK